MPSEPFTRRALLAGAGVLAAGGVATACTRVPYGRGTAPDLYSQLRSQGYARLAIGNEPPYTRIDPDGSVTGVEPDVAAAVLRRLGIPKVQGIVTPYAGMIPGLNARRWDMITAGLFMKRSRCSQVDYADPVLVSTESFAVRKGNPLGLRRLADVLADGKVRVGVLSGAYEAGIAKERKVPAHQIVQIPDGRSGIDALEAGRIDAFFLPTLSLQALGDTSRFDVTKPLPDVPPTGSSAAFRRSDHGFRDRYNKALHQLQHTGEFARILRRWGFDPTLPPRYTAAQLCKAPG